MATFNSDKVTLRASAEKAFDKLSNLENLKTLLEKVPADRIPDDKREMFDNIVITPDTISIPGGPVGQITLRKTDMQRPELIRLEGENTPVPMALMLELTPVSEVASEARAVIDIAIPAMLKPMVSGPLNKIVSQFSQVLGAIPFD